MTKARFFLLILIVLTLCSYRQVNANGYLSSLNNKHKSLPIINAAPSPKSPSYIIPQMPLFSYGFKGGLSMSRLIYLDFLEFEGDLQFPVNNISYGGSFHAFGIAKFNSYLSFQGEIGFEQKGGNFDWIDYEIYSSTAKILKNEDEFRITNNYLTFPITARVSFGKDVRFSIFSGYYFAWLITSKIKTYKSYQTIEVEQVKTFVNQRTYNSIDYFKRTESGLLFGINLQIPVYQIRLGPAINLLIDARYNIGFTPIDEFNNDYDIFFGKPIYKKNNMLNLNYLISTGVVISLPEPYNRRD